VPLIAALICCGSASALQVFPVSIVNDTTGAVVVRDCDHYCSSSPIAITLQPEGSAPINRVANDHKAFSITTVSGAHVGCLDLFFPTPQPGASVLVTDATPCTGHARPRWQTGALVVLLVGILGAPFVLVRRR
jgi:hypothetical protein